MPLKPYRTLIAAAALTLVPSAAPAQLLPHAGGLVPNVLPTVTGTLRNTTNNLDSALNNTVTIVRDTVGRPAAVTARVFETDINGANVVRGEILAISPTNESLATAGRLDFEIARRENLETLGLSLVVLRAPDGMSVTTALAALRNADPAGSYDYNHIYNPSGERSGTSASVASPPPGRSDIRIGMIDGGIDRRNPALRQVNIESKTFAGKGSGLPSDHGTAVASLLVGRDGDFHGALDGASLYAADVYGGVATGGSADDIARALAWLAANQIPVTNISLTGPPNALLAAATAAFVKTGHVLVAAVGNDGPAAPARYPAAYPGVIGVTSVDADRTIQIDANRGPDVAFAALGVSVRAASQHGRYAKVTGTSFAAPVIAARFALLMDHPDPAAATHAFTILQGAALDLGAPGRDSVFGYGYLDTPAVSSLAQR